MGKDDYMNNFNCQPMFKVYISSGIVMIPEVGKYNKKFACHRDAMNSPAIISSGCNELNKKLLILKILQNRILGNGLIIE